MVRALHAELIPAVLIRDTDVESADAARQRRHLCIVGAPRRARSRSGTGLGVGAPMIVRRAS